MVIMLGVEEGGYVKMRRPSVCQKNGGLLIAYIGSTCSRYCGKPRHFVLHYMLGLCKDERRYILFKIDKRDRSAQAL